MAYRLPGERVALDLDGPSVEVEPIRAWAMQHLGVALYAAVNAAKPGDAMLVALRELYRFVLGEAQPSWDIVDHRGPVPVSEVGMLRLPLDLGLGISLGWLGTFDVAKPASAVDALIPPGELNTALKRRLAAAKRKAA